MKFPFLLCTALLLFFSTAKSQEVVYDTTSSHEMIEKGIALYDEDKPDDALKIYLSISPCDPNYWWALYESALVYIDKEQYKKALDCCRESDSLNPDNLNTLSLTGSILDYMGRNKEAIDHLSRALVARPYNQNLLHNLAASYTRSGQLAKAEALLIKSLHVNPYHAKSHLLLARINFEMGRLAQSYLAYNMAILMTPSVQNLSTYEDAVTGKLDTMSRPYKHPYPAGLEHGKWDELTAIMRSEAAFGKKSGYDYPLTYLTAKQSFLLFKKIKFEAGDTSLYNQYYVRFFAEMMKKDYFETYLNYTYKNINDESVETWRNKNQNKLDAFVDWATGALNKWRESGFSVRDEEKNVRNFHFNEEGQLISIGQMNLLPEESNEGEWLGIDSEGYVDKKGKFIHNKMEGEWLSLFPNGNVRQHLFYSNGLLNGTIKTFYSNGKPNGTYRYENGEKEGTHTEYTPSGQILTEYNFRDHLLNGKKTDYYYPAGYFSVANYIDDKQEGLYQEYWLNGTKKAEVNTKDSLNEGPYKTWYVNAVPSAEGIYNKDILTGKWTDFYPDGTKKAEGEKNAESELTGIRTMYRRNGGLDTRDSAYVKGKLSGTQHIYHPGGALSNSMTIENDIILKSISYDANGKIIHQDETSNGKIKLHGLYPDGTLFSEGVMQDNKREGTWLFYDPFGRKQQLMTYVNGMLSGPQKVFHPNGRIKEEYSCDSDLIIGPYRSYFSSGKLKLKGNCNKKGRYGEWVSYYGNDSIESRSCYEDNTQLGRLFLYGLNGKIRSVETFNYNGISVALTLFDPNGNVSGAAKYKEDSVLIVEKYPNGSVRSKRYMVNNQLHGMHETFLPNGKLISQIPYMYGKLNGNARRWEFDGGKEFEIPYTMGFLYGKLKRFRDGRPWYYDDYINTELHGLRRELYPDGKIYARIMYAEDEKEGNADFFGPDSIPAYRLIYWKGCLKSYTYCNAQGNYIPEIPLNPESTEILCYYPNGKISCKIPIKQGLVNGHARYFFPNGMPSAEKHFQEGDLEGQVTFYYPNGKIREVISYHLDDRNGLYENFYENGIKKSSGNYCCDNADGEWKIYDKLGKLQNTVTYYLDEVYDVR